MNLEDIGCYLRDPKDGTSFDRVEGERLLFLGGNRYPTIDGVPILIDEANSLFTAKEILSKSSTTQSEKYRDRTSAKNFIRQRLLPSLSDDKSARARYRRLADIAGKEKVLIIGAGDKVEYYKQCFPDSEVIASDVHCQFGADIILDAHDIPFDDDVFSVVLLPQVLEHTSRPWDVAVELQRVTRIAGVIQVEVPFVFPWHSAPYDFYRFTPSALRFLFSRCEIERFEVTEGSWSAVAVTSASAIVNIFTNRIARMVAVALSRILFWWMKYLDSCITRNRYEMPKGYSVMYRFDGIERSERQLLEEVSVLSRT